MTRRFVSFDSGSLFKTAVALAVYCRGVPQLSPVAGVVLSRSR